MIGPVVRSCMVRVWSRNHPGIASWPIPPGDPVPEMTTIVTYEITAEVREDLVPSYEAYMRGTHVPDLLATGHFVAASFGRAAPGRYRIRYEARDATALQCYLADHAPRLRAHFDGRFPEGIRLSREVWTVLEQWPEDSGTSAGASHEIK